MTENELVSRWINEYIQTIPTFYVEELYSNDVEGWEEVTIGHEDDDNFKYYALPIWGTMYRFGFEADAIWLESHIKEVSDCGFRIYHWKKYDEYIFGINGCGYSFIEAHWKPLYKKWIGE